MRPAKLYAFVAAAWLAGTAWLVWNTATALHDMPAVCLFRRITGLPCPSCGATHSLVYLSHGDFAGAWFANPLGYVLAIGMMVVPALLLFDLLLRRTTFYYFYTLAEARLRKPGLAIPLLLLLLANWAWSILKYTA